jgi:hypothetical protein
MAKYWDKIDKMDVRDHLYVLHNEERHPGIECRPPLRGFYDVAPENLLLTKNPPKAVI